MNHPVLRKGFIPQPYVSYKEAYSLFHYLITGRPFQRRYFDQRNQVIHNAIENMYKNGWKNKSLDSLIIALADTPEQHELEDAGGEAYIRKLIGNFDYARDVEPGVAQNG